MNEGKELVAQNTPAVLVQMAIDQNADIEKLERLMNLQIRWEENEAKKAYHAAMTAFKEDPPKIEKDKKVAYKDTRYSHASLANVTEKISTALSRHGLSAAWKTDQQNNTITVTCTITHVGGYSESTSLSAAPDTSGAKNSIQAIGSTISYLERYTILALTGLATHDMDDDGKISGGFIDENQAADLRAVCEELNVNIKIFLKGLGAESFETIPKHKFDMACAVLEQKRKGK